MSNGNIMKNMNNFKDMQLSYIKTGLVQFPYKGESKPKISYYKKQKLKKRYFKKITNKMLKGCKKSLKNIGSVGQEKMIYRGYMQILRVYSHVKIELYEVRSNLEIVKSEYTKQIIIG